MVCEPWMGINTPSVFSLNFLGRPAVSSVMNTANKPQQYRQFLRLYPLVSLCHVSVLQSSLLGDYGCLTDLLLDRNIRCNNHDACMLLDHDFTTLIICSSKTDSENGNTVRRIWMLRQSPCGQWHKKRARALLCGRCPARPPPRPPQRRRSALSGRRHPDKAGARPPVHFRR